MYLSSTPPTHNSTISLDVKLVDGLEYIGTLPLCSCSDSDAPNSKHFKIGSSDSDAPDPKHIPIEDSNSDASLGDLPMQNVDVGIMTVGKSSSTSIGSHLNC
jgi:hypothetical protein